MERKTVEQKLADNAAYGVRELSPIDPNLQDEYLRGGALPQVSWNDPSLATITRLRLLTDSGFPLMDVSYCWGRLKDGSPCEVQLPFSQLPKRTWKRAIIQYAKRDRVYANGLNIFANTSILY